MMPEIGDRFIDRYGDIWVYIAHWSVKRERDGNLGTWDSGKGLELV